MSKEKLNTFSLVYNTKQGDYYRLDKRFVEKYSLDYNYVLRKIVFRSSSQVIFDTFKSNKQGEQLAFIKNTIIDTSNPDLTDIKNRYIEEQWKVEIFDFLS